MHALAATTESHNHLTASCWMLFVIKHLFIVKGPVGV